MLDLRPVTKGSPFRQTIAPHSPEASPGRSTGNAATSTQTPAGQYQGADGSKEEVTLMISRFADYVNLPPPASRWTVRPCVAPRLQRGVFLARVGLWCRRCPIKFGTPPPGRAQQIEHEGRAFCLTRAPRCCTMGPTIQREGSRCVPQPAPNADTTTRTTIAAARSRNVA